MVRLAALLGVLLLLLADARRTQSKHCTAIQLDAGTTRLDLKGCGLARVPEHIDWCALKSLTFVDMSQNFLERIPTTLACATAIRVLFLSANPGLNHVPKFVRSLPSLKMYAQRSSGLTSITASDFPPSLEWLILMDNALESLPDLSSFPIRKLMLSHNRLASVGALPRALEMLSLANNRLRSLPESVRTAARLTWVVLSSNPLLDDDAPPKPRLAVPELPLDQFPRLQTLATNQDKSVVRSAVSGRRVAIKFFGARDSSGLPRHEVRMCGAVGDHHRNIINTLGVQLTPARRPAVALEFLDADDGWAPMGGRPNFETITRGTFGPQHDHFSAAEIAHVGILVARALAELHALGIVHGDVYAHNVMARARRGLTARAELKLGDFGTAMRLTPALREQLLAWEVRAFGLMLDDMLIHSRPLRNPQLSRGLIQLKTEILAGGAQAGLTPVARMLNDLVAGWTAVQGIWRDPSRTAAHRYNITVEGLLVSVNGRDVAGTEWNVFGFANDDEGSFLFDFSPAGGSAGLDANYSRHSGTLHWGDGMTWARTPP